MLRLLPLLATAWVVGASSSPSPSPPSRPNFVVIFLDDAGWGDAGFNVGQEAVPETKVLDRLATEGLRFTDFHAAASVCTPSRASLLTGRLGLRTGVVTNFREGALGGLPQTEVTLAELLRDQAGYHTVMLGKWHLGTHPPFHPSYRGFDRYLGVPYSVDMGCTNAGADHPPSLPCCQGAWSTGPPPVPNPDPEHPHRHLIEVDAAPDTSSPSAPFFTQPSPGVAAGPRCVEAPAVPLYNSTGPQCSSKPSCNQDIIEQPVNLISLARRYGEFAEAFVEEQAKNKGTTRTPFFLYMALSHMHVPLAYDPRFENASSRTDRRIYGNTLAEVDFEVGRIVDALHRTGLANDTLVLITSDNGPWDMKCHLAGLTGPYEGRYMAEHHGTGTGKFTTWEGGHRVPTLAYWPSRIAPGVTGALTSTMDIFPTFAALAGAVLPANRSFDGLDLTSFLLQDSQEKRNDTTEGHETLFHPDQFGQLSAMRLGKYKVHFRLTQAPPCVPGDKRNMDDILEQWAFVLGDGNETKGWLDVPLVFDLEADPHEAYPLSVSQEDADMLHDLWQHKMDDIQNDFHSTPDYSQRDDPSGWPCCNVESPACFCPSAGQKMMM